MSEPAIDVRMVHERHPDWEWWDHVEIKVVPRWKESEASGSEYRRSASIVFSFKGEVFLTKTYSNMDVAASALPFIMKQSIGELHEEVDTGAYNAHELKYCDNVGCRRLWDVKYKLRTLWSQNGSFSQDPGFAVHYRQFCDQHKMRGDCGLDDADANYILIDERRP